MLRIDRYYIEFLFKTSDKLRAQISTLRLASMNTSKQSLIKDLNVRIAGLTFELTETEEEIASYACMVWQYDDAKSKLSII